ncbi:hypothetical protein DBR32_10095 [Taibaiella sp. KBW10]|uniref:hypothetical protein n=1 Tax=Taibaiella sp. KBW10 TaxID=2153357 RepID=UPI000F59336F|nr:hypothetical protein [Taibaiella sp. KBW10]RQO31048.1 hypothetical protein DBR32_10095 [Taibaiella sp. KBW10]
MKKVLLGLLALAGTAGIAAANTLTITNLTSCPYTLSISGTGSGGGGAMVGAGASITYTSGAGLNIGAIKIMYVSGTNFTQVNVGYGFFYSNSIGQPTPPCLTGTYFTASWAQASPTDNATLVIF